MLDDLDELEARTSDQRAELAYFLNKLTEELNEDEPDVEQVKELCEELKTFLIETAHEYFDLAYTISSWKSGSALRGLKGEEPIGYSKRDGGVTHDAYYGARAQGAQMARHVGWPLDLKSDKWDVEEWERVGRDEWDKVEAKGQKKYSRTIGGRKVYVVLGERPPPI